MNKMIFFTQLNDGTNIRYRFDGDLNDFIRFSSSFSSLNFTFPAFSNALLSWKKFRQMNRFSIEFSHVLDLQNQWEEMFEENLQQWQKE